MHNNKLSKVVLSTILATQLLFPFGVYAETEETPTTKEETTENESADKNDQTSNSDSTTPQENKNIGMPDETAVQLQKDIMTILISYGATGQPTTAQFYATDKKPENTKLFNQVVNTQLQLYELLYATGIQSQLTEPVKDNQFSEGQELNNLKSYLTALESINKFVKDQIELIKATDGYNTKLVEALELLVLDLSEFNKDSITKETPMITLDIRANILNNVNSKVANSINTYFQYLNNEKLSDDIDELTKAELKDTTISLLTLVKQWGNLPHIPNATDQMKPLSIGNLNQEWLTALYSLMKEISTDNGGTTDGNQATNNNSTNPELATSPLGRLGSSLFTVVRSEGADAHPNKPLTNTLAWTIHGDRKGHAYDPGPTAKDDFLAMFASTAVYTPFISKLGDKDYVEAYKSLFNSKPAPLEDHDEKVRFEGNALGPLDILNQVQNLKKPLYYYNDLEALGENTVYGHSTKDVKGVASLLTVGDLINTIENKKELAAITVHGVMAQDMDSWSFYNYSLNKDGQVQTEAPADDTAGANPNTEVIGAPVTNKVSAGKTVNAGQENTRVILEMTYNDKNPGAALTTGALMHNIYNDTILKARFKERATEAVYIDPIGNIVLNDGLVVLPAAANPTYWAMPNASTKEGAPNQTQSWMYNPFTVAFMDTYPAIYEGGTAPSSVNMKKDKNKYILSSFGSEKGSYSVLPLKSGFRNGFAVTLSGVLNTEFKLDGQREIVDSIVNTLEKELHVDGKESVASDSWYNIGNMKPLQFKNVLSSDSDSLFPYLTSQVIDSIGQDSFNTSQPSYQSSIYIAKNMYAYIIGEVDSKRDNITAANGKSSGGSSVGKLREGFLFNNVTMPVLTGVTNSIEFDKTNAKSDLLQAGGDTALVTRWIMDASKALAAHSRDYFNILAIANSDDVSLMKLIYGMTIDYGYYVIFILMFLLIVIFLRESDFMVAFIKGGTIIALLFICLFVLPLLIPKLTGITADKLAHNTVLNSLLTKLEMNEEVNDAKQAGNSGVSIKLYNLSPKQAKEVNNQYSIRDSNYLTNKFSINDNLGLYVDGTELRLDLYSFLRFDPLIVATSDKVNNPNNIDGVPQIYHSDHSMSKYVTGNEQFADDMKYNNDVIDYYMPYNLLENGLMKTLNTYLQYYNPPQSVVKYPDGLVKSSYIIPTYMKSLAFLSGEPEVARLIAESTEEDEYSHRGFTKLEVDTVNKYFYPYGDIFNLQWWVDTEWGDLKPEYANSLWAQTMMKAGYYTPGSGIEKRLALADKVNRNAYKIIMDFEKTNGLVSDETLIKVLSLYATFEWNKTISYINHNVYPQAPSLSEVTVADILNSTVLSNANTFVFYDVSLISNVYASDGIKGLFSITISMLMLIVYSIAISWVLPILIVGLLVYSVYLIFINQSIMPALIFAFKMLSIIVITNLALTSLIVSYGVYDSMYVMTIFLIGLNMLFAYLVMKYLIKDQNRLENSWQSRHTRRMGFSKKQSYGYEYDRSNDEGYNRYTYPEEQVSTRGGTRTRTQVAEMREYLEESEGVYGRNSRNR